MIIVDLLIFIVWIFAVRDCLNFTLPSVKAMALPNSISQDLKKYGIQIYNFLNHSFTTLSVLHKKYSSSHPVLTYAFDIAVGTSLTGLVLLTVRKGWKRYTNPFEIPQKIFKNNGKLVGYIATVNDSDNVRFFHTPFLRRISHSLLSSTVKTTTSTPSFSVKTAAANDSSIIPTKKISTTCINVRLAGIDAPECAHFGNQGQPFSSEAKSWLTSTATGRKAWIVPHRIDQYGRLVASVYIRKFFFFKYNLSLEMVKNGWACVYDSAGAEYGGIKDQLYQAEAKAKSKKKGMWQSDSWISPKEYKKSLK